MAGTAGADVVLPWRCRTGALDTPALRVATMESEIDVSMKRMAEIVVALESNVAEPLGPKAV